jgi:hypothetical protein
MIHSRHRREVAVTQDLPGKSGDEHSQKRKRLRPGTVIVVLADCPSTVALVL